MGETSRGLTPLTCARPDRSRRFGLCLVLALSTAVACESTGCDGCSDRKKSDAVASAAEPEVLTPPGSDIEMVRAGAEPRAYLRIGRWPGLRYRQTIQSDGSWGMQGQEAIQGPSLTLVFVYEVLRGTADPLIVAADGGEQRLVEERAILQAVTVKHDAVAPAVVAEYNRQLAGFNGSSLRQLIGEAGEIVELKSELLGGVTPPPELKNGIDQALDVQRRFPFRLPPIPVGEGASWRFREKIVVNGAHAFQVAEMTLREMDEETASIRFTVRLEAPRQEVPHPFSPGEKATLDVFRGDGDGEMTLDRLTGIPLRGRFATTARLTLTGDVGGQQKTATFFAASVITSSAELLDETESGEAGAEG